MAGLDAFGTQLERSDMAETDPTFSAIANVGSITPPGTSRETLDVTAHDSPDGWREYLGGLKDGGEFSAELNYDPTEHDTLLEDYEDDVPRDYRFVFPDADQTTWEVKGILTGFEPEAPHDDKLAATATFQVSGKPNFAAGAA